MGSNVPCPYCGTALWDDGSLAGQEVECPRCRGRLRMPGGPPPGGPAYGQGVATQTQRIEHVHVLARSPGVAAVLSFFWAGLGQIYCGQLGKGLAFMAAGPAIAGLGVAAR